MVPHEQLVVVATTREQSELRVPLQPANFLLVYRVLLVRTLLRRTRIAVLNAAIARTRGDGALVPRKRANSPTVRVWVVTQAFARSGVPDLDVTLERADGEIISFLYPVERGDVVMLA